MHDNDENKYENDDLDLLLRSALATYTDPGDTHDLDRRILTRFFGAPARPRRRWLPWTIALPLAASLLLAIHFFIPLPAGHRRIAAPRAADRAVASSNRYATLDEFPLPQSGPIMPLQLLHPAPDTATQRSAPPALSPHHDRSVFPTPQRPASRAVAGLPKRDVFPTPQPLTPAEQALATYAAEAPERRTLIAAQKPADTPLTIAAIHIPPLSPPDTGANSPDPGTN